MSGVAGKSGRRPKTIDEQRHRIVDLAWSVAKKILKDETIKVDDKAKVAVPMVVKSMVDVGEQTVKVTRSPEDEAEITRLWNKARGIKPIITNELNEN